MVIRERYLKLIRPFYDQELIKVLIGIRRSGKSVILKQIIEEYEIPKETLNKLMENLSNEEYELVYNKLK